MDLEEQIKETRRKILELGLSDAPPSFIQDEERHLNNLIELNNKDDSEL